MRLPKKDRRSIVPRGTSECRGWQDGFELEFATWNDRTPRPDREVDGEFLRSKQYQQMSNLT